MALPADPGALLTVVDYARITGLNSLEAIGTVAEILRSRCSNNILCLHADSPEHDFGTLLAGLGAPGAYPQRLPGVHAAVVPRSLHGACAPPGTVDLALCSTSIHWLSRAPLSSASSFVFEELSPSERAAVEAQAAEDWRAFLARRAEELRPGGALLLVAGVRPRPADEAQRDAWRIFNSIHPGCLARGIRDAVAAGEWAPGEAARVVPLFHYRTLEDFTGPFEDGTAPAGLALERVETRQTNNIGSFQALLGVTGPGPSPSDLAAAAARIVAMQFAHLGAYLEAALDEGRGPEGRAAALAAVRVRMLQLALALGFPPWR
eukprot:tig00020510_g9806.t1